MESLYTSPTSFVIHMLKPWSQYDGILSWGLWGGNEVIRVKSYEWDWCSHKKRHMEKMTLFVPHEDTARKQPSASQDESPSKDPTMLAPWFQTSSLHNWEKCFLFKLFSLWHFCYSSLDGQRQESTTALTKLGYYKEVWETIHVKYLAVSGT